MKDQPVHTHRLAQEQEQEYLNRLASIRMSIILALCTGVDMAWPATSPEDIATRILRVTDRLLLEPHTR